MSRKIRLEVSIAGILLFALAQIGPTPLLIATGLAEETREEEIYKLEEVVVREKKTPKGVENVILEDEIGKLKTSRTVDGLLENLAGIDVQRSSPGGDRGRAVSIRGLDESRSLIMLDGRRLNGTGVYGGDYVDWSSLSIEDVERVEVIRGAKSAEYGNTLGGIINIVTRKGKERLKTDVVSSYGTFNTIEARFSHSGGYKFIMYNLSVGNWQTDGYLRNNFVNRNNFSGRIMFLLPEEINLRFGARYTMHKRGFVVENHPGDPYYDSDYPESDDSAGGGPGIRFKEGDYTWGDESYWKNLRGQYDINLRKPFGSLDLNAGAYFISQDRTEYFYAITDKDKLILERYAIPEKNTWGWHVKASQSVKEHDLRYGIEGGYRGSGGIEIKNIDESYFIKPVPISFLETRNITQQYSAFVQDYWALKPAIDLSLGLRYDYYHADESEATIPGKITDHAVNPKFGITYKGWQGGKIDISVGQAYRFPTCPESYWYYGGYQPAGREGALSPEKAIQAEIGVSHKFEEKATVGLRTYYYDVDNYIRTIFGYKPSRVVYNIDKVMFLGAEIEGEYKPVENISIFGNYTYQTTKKKGDILDMSTDLTDKLTELPEHKVNMGLRYHLPNDAIVTMSLRGVGSRSTLTGSLATPGASELVNLRSFVTVGLDAAYPILKKGGFVGSVKLGIENLFDAEYEEQNSFPMPGRTITAGVNITF